MLLLIPKRAVTLDHSLSLPNNQSELKMDSARKIRIFAVVAYFCLKIIINIVALGFLCTLISGLRRQIRDGSEVCLRVALLGNLAPKTNHTWIPLEELTKSPKAAIHSFSGENLHSKKHLCPLHFQVVLFVSFFGALLSNCALVGSEIYFFWKRLSRTGSTVRPLNAIITSVLYTIAGISCILFFVTARLYLYDDRYSSTEKIFYTASLGVDCDASSGSKRCNFQNFMWFISVLLLLDLTSLTFELFLFDTPSETLEAPIELAPIKKHTVTSSQPTPRLNV